MCSMREWDTPVREPWNALIHQGLRAIDRHMHCYFDTGNTWHLEKAEGLRVYIMELKMWIHKCEGK